MSALVKKLRSGAFPMFDYAALSSPDIEQRARAAVVKIRESQRVAVVDIGQVLLEMKEALPHGQFLPWVESFGMSRRTAVDFMHVAEAFGSRWAAVAHLPPAVIYKLAAPSTPAAVREAVMEIGSDKTVTIEGVRELIDGLKATERRKDRRNRRDEIRQEQDAQRAKWEARYAKDRAELERVRAATEAATAQVKALLADVLPDLSTILEQVDPFTLGQIIQQMVARYRAQSKMGAPT